MDGPRDCLYFLTSQADHTLSLLPRMWGMGKGVPGMPHSFYLPTHISQAPLLLVRSHDLVAMESEAFTRGWSLHQCRWSKAHTGPQWTYRISDK